METEKGKPASLLMCLWWEREAVFTFHCHVTRRRRRKEDVEREKGEVQGIGCSHWWAHWAPPKRETGTQGSAACSVAPKTWIFSCGLNCARQIWKVTQRKICPTWWSSEVLIRQHVEDLVESWTWLLKRRGKAEWRTSGDENGWILAKSKKAPNLQILILWCQKCLEQGKCLLELSGRGGGRWRQCWMPHWGWWWRRWPMACGCTWISFLPFLCQHHIHSGGIVAAGRGGKTIKCETWEEIKIPKQIFPLAFALLILREAQRPGGFQQAFSLVFWLQTYPVISKTSLICWIWCNSVVWDWLHTACSSVVTLPRMKWLW